MACDYYPEFEVATCAQHVEAKRLANRLWAKYGGIIDKRVSEIYEIEPDLDRIAKLGERANSVLQEFKNIRRGLMRCCAAN